MPPRKKTATDAAPAEKPARKPRATTKKKADPDAPAPSKPKKPRVPNPSGPDLVIVESPSKAKTIEKYLGNNFTVRASYGHIRDLPQRRRKGEALAGVDIEGGWVPTYIINEDEGGRGRRSKRDIVKELEREVARANRVYLATDPDREGEAIAWHLAEVLNLDEASTFRVAFNEITRTAVHQAMANPGKVNMNRVKAQEGRRILDRAVGYPLSALLGKKVARGSSAGRVQSVALRLVVDREREIEAFKSEEYWRLTALLAPEGTVQLTRKPLNVVRLTKDAPPAADEPDDAPEGETKGRGAKPKRAAAPQVPAGAYLAELVEWAGKKYDLPNADAAGEAAALEVARLLDTAKYTLRKLEQKETQERPAPPFITSTLQQTASNRLGLPGERTMRIAQHLYEGVDLGAEGRTALITYMRTDSTRVSNEALGAVRGHIQANYGPNYLPAQANVYSSGKSAQEAHEAIRPTDVSMTPERVARLGLDAAELRVYTLIWNRFVASQMSNARFAVTTATIDAVPQTGDRRGVFRAGGRVQLFDGYRRVMPAGKSEESELPTLREGQAQDRIELNARQHATKPPPRFNEAALIKALEKEGIGRPSTYASIIGKITSEDRGYIEVKERRFFATTIGKIVTDLLVEHFPKVMDLKFTSLLEDELDDIEKAKLQYRQVLDDFWGPFSTALAAAEEKMPSKRGEETGEPCPKCGRPLVKNFSKKLGREFIGCSGYKEGCKYIKPREGEPERDAPIETEHKCPVCGKVMLQKTGKRGPFLSCSGYPDCKTTMNITDGGAPVITAKPTEYKCEKCGKDMVLRTGRRGPFLACSGYPACKNAKDVDDQGKPVVQQTSGIDCPTCKSPMAVKRGPRGPFLGCTAYPKCRKTMPMTDELREQLGVPKPPPKKALPEVEVTETCPKCNGPMKLRQGPRGLFLGCMAYPKCKGVREAPAALSAQAAAEE
ncbi:MAG: type I DNA topoisomerase [Gemmataceae bacterium]